MTTYLELIPEQIDALWSLVDAEFIDGDALILGEYLMRHPHMALYKGDRLEDATDQTLVKVLDQLVEKRTEGNIELTPVRQRGLDEVLDTLCRGTPFYGKHPYFQPGG